MKPDVYVVVPRVEIEQFVKQVEEIHRRLEAMQRPRRRRWFDSWVLPGIIVGGLLLAALIPRACAAQGIGFFLRHDRASEYTAGAGLNLLSRGPWIAKGWRHAPIRFVGVQLTSYAYERLFDYAGFSGSDYRQRLYGYLLTETVIELGRLVLHHPARAP